MARRPRGLTQDDLEIWSHVTKGISAKPKPVVAPVVKRMTKVAAPAQSMPLAPFHIGEKAVSHSTTAIPDFKEAPARTSPNMDGKNFQRLLRGKMEIDATLDLHGLTADQAKVRLTQFLRQGHARGLRMILVITGKGRTHGVDEFNRPKGGVLRASLPDWLRGPGLSHLVLQVTPAQQRHGGSGAWYVYLRRQR